MTHAPAAPPCWPPRPGRFQRQRLRPDAGLDSAAREKGTVG